MQTKDIQILVVDDSDSIRGNISAIIADQGYTVGAAANGRDALRMIKNSSFDLILLDVVLPDIDGYKVCRTLKQNEFTKNIPIIFLTAKNDQDSLKKGFEAGCSDYIPKPVYAEELLIRVENHLAIKKSKEDLELELQKRKQVENDLKTSKAELDQAQRMAKIGSWIWYRESNSVRISDGFKRLMHLEPNVSDIVEYIELVQMIHPEDRLYVFDRLREIFFSGETEELEFRMVIGNTENWYKIEQPIVKEIGIHGKPSVVVGTVQEITEHKKHEAELIAARKLADKANVAKSDFLANMSHEIRTPLNTILGFSEALFYHSADESIKSKLSSINASGKALLALINDILDLSKIEAGHLELQYSSCDIRSVLAEVELVFAQKIEENADTLSIQVSDDVPSLLSLDEFRFKQVLLNLVSNALKFTTKGTIEIILDATNKNAHYTDLRISVRDTGIGIAETDIADIFKSFRQSKGQSVRKYGGTGLGLAICKQIVERWGGKISVESTLGHGASFTFVIPHTEILSGIASVDQTVSADIVSFHQSQVLVIDDNESNYLALQYLLNQDAVEFVYAPDVQTAIAKLHDISPSLILIDMWLDGIDGVKVARHFSKNTTIADIPFIAYTASSGVQDDPEALALFEGVLSKPTNRESLVSLLVKYLPYTTHSGTGISSAQSIGTNIFTISKLDAEKLTPLCEEYYMPIKDDLDISGIEVFAEKMIESGKSISNEEVGAFGEKLLSYIKVFDIESIQKQMNQFGLGYEKAMSKAE